MKVLDKETKFAHLGKPGTGFTKGFQRRLNKIVKKIELTDKTILDQGCGIGVWMHEFKQFTKADNIYGFDIDPESLEEFKKINKTIYKDNPIPEKNIKVSTGEELKFEDDKFDIVFSNEVLEHVEDDIKSSSEVLRTLKDGGSFIIFTPNRGWPFETHGMFFRGKYIWGNIPFLPWMPKFIRNKFSPHVRNYSNSDIKKVLKQAQSEKYSFEITHHSHVFPAFDNLERRFGIIGKIFQKFFHTIEKTPLHFFGISHFIIATKVKKQNPRKTDI